MLFIKIMVTLFIVLLTITIHEFGHYLAARYYGVKVKRFIVGFGPIVWSWRSRHDIEYGIAACPLGGYVELLDKRQENIPPELASREFTAQPLRARFVILIAGVTLNLLLSVAAFFTMFSIGTERIEPIVAEVVANTPASAVDIREGDRIISVAGYPAEDWAIFGLRMLQRLGDSGAVTIVVQRQPGATVITKKISLSSWSIDYRKPDPFRSLGMMPIKNNKAPPTLIRKYGPVNALYYAIQEAQLNLLVNASLCFKILMGKLSIKMLGGPLALLSVSGFMLQQGIDKLIWLIAILNLTVAYINILPLPALDGGQLVYVAYEKIMGKPVTIAAQVLAYRLTWIALIMLLITIFINDIERYVL